jgi:hypothetical protein
MRSFTHATASRDLDLALAVRSPFWYAAVMTGKQFFDWQTGGGTNDVMGLVDCSSGPT